MIHDLQKNKTPEIHLLDMVLGWAQYVQSIEGESPLAVHLFDLYQQAGSLFAYGESLQEPLVSRFLEEKVFPLICPSKFSP